MGGPSGLQGPGPRPRKEQVKQLLAVCPGITQSSGESESAVDKPKGLGEVREKEEP